jgi:hypothetical protein
VGAGNADAPALAGRVTESAGQASLESGEPVQALGGRVRDPGQDRADDLVLPPGYRPGQAGHLGDVVVAGAPVVEGEEPAPDVTLARDRTGDAGAQVRRVTEFSLAIQAAAISCPAGSLPKVPVTLANWAGDRCSRFRVSRFLMPYSGSPDRPRRRYLPRTTRRRTSPVIFTARCTTWNKSTAICAPGSIRRTAEA